MFEENSVAGRLTFETDAGLSEVDNGIPFMAGLRFSRAEARVATVPVVGVPNTFV